MNPMKNSSTFHSDEHRWQAVRDRDLSADGAFFFAVKTTGVFCLPGCSSRQPRRRNVEFFDSAADAVGSGYRPCKRCRPGATAPRQQLAELIAHSCRRLEAATEPPSLAELAADADLSPAHFHRLFKKALGVTPKQYAAGHRLGRFRDQLQTSPTVTDAIYAAGFGSSSRAYENVAGSLGMTPSAYKKGGAGLAIRYATAPCSLGRVVVAATDLGICAIELADDDQPAAALLANRFPAAALTPADEDFTDQVQTVAAFVDTPGQEFDLPLDVQGTAFQRRVWEALRKIPPGTTVSYGELATLLGQPTATRAVASACAANPVAVVVPCHRVGRADGSLGGYRWGIERKREIQQREKKLDEQRPELKVSTDDDP